MPCFQASPSASSSTIHIMYEKGFIWWIRLTHSSRGDLDAILKMQFSIWLYLEIFFCKYVQMHASNLTDNKWALVQVMAWCRQAISHYLSQCWPRAMSPYGVTGLQWVKTALWGVCTHTQNALAYTLRVNHIKKIKWNAVKPVCNDHLYNTIYYLWFIP